MRTFEVLKPMGFRRRGEQGLTSYLPGELVKLSDKQAAPRQTHPTCLLYTSDAADE